MSELFIDKLMDPKYNPYGIARLTSDSFKTEFGSIPGTTTDGPDEITFVISDDFKLSGGNEWGVPLATSVFNNITKELTGFAQSGALALGGIADATNSDKINQLAAKANEMAQKVVKDLRQTIKTYSGSQTPPFPIQFLKIATRPDHDIRVDAKRFFRLNLPSRTTEYGGNLTMRSPLGYRPIWDTITNLGDLDSLVAPPGTMTLHFGTWFKMGGLLAKSVQLVFSKACISTGLPLYLQGQIELVPWRDLLIDDMDAALSGSGITSDAYLDMLKNGTIKILEL